ncbi:MAG: biopolymer transporter ExbD [Saprospiraceae bacterium]|nr:biopolymer transporter ExbD [Saprospiraceae bacterium]
MGLKKRNKVSAQFNMSSLTDIIFLLLIFFMLTSSLVAPNALNLKLPGSSPERVTSTRELDDVRISSRGSYYLNGKRISLENLDRLLAQRARGSRQRMSILISPAERTPVESVVAVMDIAMKYNINGILAAEK